MRIAFGCDHRGVLLRDGVLQELAALGHEAVDLGERDDYPDAAADVAGAICAGRADRGVLVCSTGVGVAIAACKHPGIRASVCHDGYSRIRASSTTTWTCSASARRSSGPRSPRSSCARFAGAEFDGGERHRRRLAKIEPVSAFGR